MTDGKLHPVYLRGTARMIPEGTAAPERPESGRPQRRLPWLLRRIRQSRTERS